MTETTFGSVSHYPEQASEPLPPQSDLLRDGDWHPLTGGVLVIPGESEAAWIEAVGRMQSNPPKFQRWTKWVLR